MNKIKFAFVSSLFVIFEFIVYYAATYGTMFAAAEEYAYGYPVVAYFLIPSLSILIYVFDWTGNVDK